MQGEEEATKIELVYMGREIKSTTTKATAAPLNYSLSYIFMWDNYFHYLKKFGEEKPIVAYWRRIGRV